MPDVERDQPPQDKSERLTNRDRVPPKRKPTARSPKAVPEQKLAAVAEPGVSRFAAANTLTRSDLGSGRGLVYEWEFFVDALFQQLQSAGAGPQVFVYNQGAAASVWTVNHSMGTKPSVLVVDASGQELLAEVHYPDDQTTVIVHGQPYSGTAYLRV